VNQVINAGLLRFVCLLCFAGVSMIIQAEDGAYEEDTILKEADAFFWWWCGRTC